MKSKEMLNAIYDYTNSVIHWDLLASPSLAGAKDHLEEEGNDYLCWQNLAMLEACWEHQAEYCRNRWMLESEKTNSRPRYNLMATACKNLANIEDSIPKYPQPIGIKTY